MRTVLVVKMETVFLQRKF